MMNVSCLRCGDDFLAGCLRASVGDVFINGSVEQPGILQDHRIGGTQTLSCDIRGAESVHKDLTAVNIVETHQQVDKGGLSGTGRTYDGDEASFRSLHTEIFQNHFIFGISKIHILQFDIAFHAAFVNRKSNCIGRIRRFRIFIHDFKYTFGSSQRRLQFAVDFRHFTDRSGEFAGI